MSEETPNTHMLWFLFPILLTTLAIIVWVTWVWYGVFKLRKERAAEEARAEQDRLERGALETQVEYLNQIKAMTGFWPFQGSPSAGSSRGA